MTLTPTDKELGKVYLELKWFKAEESGVSHLVLVNNSDDEIAKRWAQSSLDNLGCEFFKVVVPKFTVAPVSSGVQVAAIVAKEGVLHHADAVELGTHRDFQMAWQELSVRWCSNLRFFDMMAAGR